MTTQLSVVLTFYNEAPNLRELIRELGNVLPLETEIILIDDMSTDSSWEIVQKITSNSLKIRYFRNPTRIGLGRSVLSGILTASSDRILLMDTDFTHNPRDLPKLLRVFPEHDLVIGSRYVEGGDMQPRNLYHSSKIYVRLLRLYMRLPIWDILGGFTLLNREKFKAVLTEEYFRGFGDFSIALCLFAHLQKLRIVEVPVCFDKRKAGFKKSKRMKMIILYFNSSRLFRKLLT